MLNFEALDDHWWLPMCSSRTTTTGSEGTLEESNVETRRHEKETLDQLDARIQEFVEKLGRCRETHIAVVGHSAFFKRYCQQVMNDVTLKWLHNPRSTV